MPYKQLVLGAGYLKNFDAATSDPQQGFTPMDIEQAQADADAVVGGWLGEIYDINEWGSPPPIVASIAERIGAAYLIRAKFHRDGRGDEVRRLPDPRGDDAAANDQGRSGDPRRDGSHREAEGDDGGKGEVGEGFGFLVSGFWFRVWGLRK